MSRTSTGDGLSISLILHISRGKDTLDVRVARSGLRDDVSFRVGLDLALEQLCGWVMAYSVEEAVGFKLLRLAGVDVLDDHVAHQSLLVALDFLADSIESHSDLLVGQEALCHRL